MAVSALILDLGNALVKHDNALLFRRFAERFSTTEEALAAQLDGALRELVNRGQLPGDALRVELQRRVGVEVSSDEFFALWNCHFTVDAQMVAEVASHVGKRRLVLLSNTHDLHVRWIRQRVPLLERFDALVLSCEVGLVKPEPDIYRRALAAAAVPAEEAAFFDDVERYVQAAAAVGLRGRVFTTVAQFRADLATL